jgi:hypothetical protein
VVLFCAAVAYYILQSLVVRNDGGCDSKLGRAIGKDWKGKLSPVIYALGIAMSFVRPAVASFLYAIVAVLWLVPDRRIERIIPRD